MNRDVQLHLFHGLPGAGKSTLAAELAAQPGTVLITQDSWLSGLYGDQMSTLADYVTCSTKLNAVLAPHIQALLGAGVRVVLDFPANTVDQRAWLRGIVQASGARHALHVMGTDPATCWARVEARQRSGAHPFTVSREQFDRVARNVTRPAQDEGFACVIHD